MAMVAATLMMSHAQPAEAMISHLKKSWNYDSPFHKRSWYQVREHVQDMEGMTDRAAEAENKAFEIKQNPEASQKVNPCYLEETVCEVKPE